MLSAKPLTKHKGILGSDCNNQRKAAEKASACSYQGALSGGGCALFMEIKLS
jgi:hypothetical protein